MYQHPHQSRIASPAGIAEWLSMRLAYVTIAHVQFCGKETSIWIYKHCILSNIIMILENYFLVFSVQTSGSLGICYKLAIKNRLYIHAQWFHERLLSWYIVKFVIEACYYIILVLA